MDDALRKLAQSVQVIRSLHRGARGGEVEGYATKGAVTEDSAPKHFHEERRKAWNSIPNHAEDVRQRLEQELNIPATISKSDTAFGRSWYVRPHIQSNDENPFVIRLSDHSANQRLHQVEARVNLMHSGPGVRAGSEQMRSNEDIEQQKNNAINFAKEYAERNRFGGGGFIRRAYQKGGKVEGSVWNDKDADVNYRGLTHSPIVQHVLDKIGASLPAAINHIGSVTGRRH